jgi:hypothetical protein
MASFCAICERPIITPQRFVIAGTEALHTECAASGAPTVLQRSTQQLETARTELARERRATTEAEIQVRREQRRADQAERQRDSHRRDLQRMKRDLEEAHAQLVAARSEAALQAVLGRRPAESPPPPTTEETPKDGRDDVVIMMSLLEFE